jgi:Predicted membrane protein (DUF2079)
MTYDPQTPDNASPFAAFDRHARWLALAMTVLMTALFILANSQIFEAGNLVKPDDHLLDLQYFRSIVSGDFRYQRELWGNPFGPGPHFCPFLVLLSLPYFVAPNVFTSLIVLSFLVAFAGLAVFELARRFGGARFGLAALAAYFLLPETWSVALSGFWHRSPLFLLLPILVLAYETKRPMLFAGFAVLAAMVRIEVLPTIALFSALALLDRRERKWLWIPPAVVVTYAAFFLAMSDSVGEGRNVVQLAATILPNAFSPRTLVALLAFFVNLSPILWLAFGTPRLLLPAVPLLWLALTFSPPDGAVFVPGAEGTQYYVATLAFFLTAAVATAARLVSRPQTKSRPTLRPAFAFLVGATALLGVYHAVTFDVIDRFKTAPAAADFKVLAHGVRPDARVATNTQFTYVLGYRPALLEFAADQDRLGWYVLRDHYFDWPALLAFRPRLNALETQRARMGEGGIAVVRSDRLRTPHREFAPDPYALTTVDHENARFALAGTVNRSGKKFIEIFRSDDAGNLVRWRQIPVASEIRFMQSVPLDPPLVILATRTQVAYFSWRDFEPRSIGGPIGALAVGVDPTTKNGLLSVAKGANVEMMTIDATGFLSLRGEAKLPAPPTVLAWLDRDTVLAAIGGELWTVALGSRGWAVQSSGQLPGEITAAQLDSKTGRLYLTTRSPAALWVADRDPDEIVFRCRCALDPTAIPTAIALGDVDGDGDTETIIGYRIGNFITLVETDDTTRRIITGPFSVDVETLDLDGDSADEIITTLTSEVPGADATVSYLAIHGVDAIILDRRTIPDEFVGVLENEGWRQDMTSGTMQLWSQPRIVD